MQTKAYRATVSTKANGCLVARVLPLRCFLVLLTNYIYQYLSVIFLFALLSDEPEEFLPKYSQTAILHAAHFRRVVNLNS